MQNNSIDDSDHQINIPQPYKWQKVVIFFNIATIISTLSLTILGSMMSRVADKYEDLLVKTGNARKSIVELEKSFYDNNKAIQALYKMDSTKQAQFRSNKKKVSNNNKQKQPIITVDTTLYVDRRYHKDPQ